MAAGQGFKTFATGDVLTAADTNGYLMQGVWVFASAAARTSAVASPQEGNMSFLKDTNSTEYYDGSAWVAVGGASGGMTLLSTTTLSGTSTSITVASNTYKNLQVYIYGANPAANADFTMRINSITANTYLERQSTGNSSGVANNYANNYTAMNLSSAGFEAIKSASGDNAWNVTFWDCNSTSRKVATASGSYLNGSSANLVMSGSYSIRDATSAISNITVISTSSLSAGTVQVYGVK
jgi:hypothetical protein